MQRIEKAIEVDVPCRTAYNQWTQFESFPAFMEAVDQVEQYDDTHLHWVATVAGKRKEWNAEIIEQVPDEVVSWRSISGAMNNGSVNFTTLGPDKCEVKLILVYEPEGIEKLGQPAVSMQLESDLKRFKEFIEQRQVETGGWRGEVRETEVKRPDPKTRKPTGKAAANESAMRRRRREAE